MQKLFLPPPTNLPTVSDLDLVPPVPTTALIPNLLESMPPWDAGSKYFLSACVAPYGFSRFTLKSPATSSLDPMGRLLMVVTKSFMEEVSSRAIQHPMICHLFCSFPIRKMDMFGPSRWINFKVIASPYSRIPQCPAMPSWRLRRHDPIPAQIHHVNIPRDLCLQDDSKVDIFLRHTEQ